MSATSLLDPPLIQSPGTVDRPPARKRWKWLVAILSPVTLILCLLWWMGVFGGNLREVSPGRFYRSAQLTGPNLEHAIRSDHIATVLNLRGANTDSAWYWQEAATCRKMHVQHLDVSMSATHLPAPDQMKKLLLDLDKARYPVLTHCMGGADRSGLVSALYLAIYEHVPLDRAENEELTWRYGHLNWTSSRKMDQFFDLYRATSNGMDLRHWIVERYPAVFRKQESS